MTPPPTRPGDERGSVSVEAAGLTFPILAFGVLLAVFAFRLTSAQLTLTSAAAAAARAASLAPSTAAALAAARTAAAADLAGHDKGCKSLTVTLDGATFGRGGTASVTVSCHLTTRALTGLSLPGSVPESATSRAPIDVFRAQPGSAGAHERDPLQVLLVHA